MREYENIRNRISEERDMPSGRVWDRLESRLDQDKGKVSLKYMYRWMGIAASILLVLAIYSNIQTANQPSSHIQVVEEIKPAAPLAAFAVYEHASDINAVYSQSNWQSIKEGTKKSLLAKAIQSQQNQTKDPGDSIL